MLRYMFILWNCPSMKQYILNLWVYTAVSIFHFCSLIVWPMKLEQEHLVWPVEISAQGWIYISGGTQRINKTYLVWNLSIGYYRCIFQLIVFVGVLCHLMWLVCVAEIYLTYTNLRDRVMLNGIKEIQGERGICFCKKGCMHERKRRRETWGSLVSVFYFFIGCMWNISEEC